MPVNQKDKVNTFRVHDGKTDNKNVSKRILTISYTYDADQKELKYGAAVFKKDLPTDVFNKKEHRQTSLARLEKRPVVVADFKDEGKIEEFQKNVRALIFKNGVRAKTPKLTSQTTYQFETAVENVE